MNQILKVEAEDRLLAFLFRALADTKKTTVKERLKHRSISVNGRVTTRFDHPLKPGDEVRIETSSVRARTPAEQFPIEVIYEDEEILVIHKPAGLLTIGTEKIRRETAIFAVNDYLNQKAHQAQRNARPEYRKRVFIVHRLDREVSGLLLFAKTEAVKLRLQENWKEVFKEYQAVVEGGPEKPSGTISSWLSQNKFLRVHSGPETPEAKKAVTHYEVVERGEKYSLLKIRLETGRKHQIRVHLAGWGHPVAGDKTYGASSRLGGRIALHASRLEFTHPVSGRPLTFTSPPPVLFRELLKSPG